MFYNAFCMYFIWNSYMRFIPLKYILLIIIINIKSSKKYTKLGKFCGVKLLPFGAHNARKHSCLTFDKQ